MTQAGPKHEPVLLVEALQALRIHPAGRYVDATYGRGGHSAAILAALGPEGRLLALDRDPEAGKHARQALAADSRFQFARSAFSGLQAQVQAWHPAGLVDGILMDIGVSSPQLDDGRRGFSFGKAGPLDMRMDPGSGVSAAEWLATADEQEIAEVLWTLGEERFSRRIARALVAARAEAPIADTGRLAALVAAAVPTREPGKHPATRTFQAIRIHINAELQELQAALAQTLAVLTAGGRLVVISFHSLEDRIVKRFMRDQARGPQLPPDLPVLASEMVGTMRLIGRAVHPGAAELARNPRARSAVMRVAERLS